MGCCPSHPYNPPAPLAYSLATKPNADGTFPLPPHDDVKETVKEVLTKTQPLPSKVPALDPSHLVNDPGSCLPKQSTWIKDSKPHVPPPGIPDDGSEDRSSEICSRSESFVSTTDDNSSSAALLRAVAPKGEGRRSNGSHSPAKKPPARTQSPESSTAATVSARRNVRRTQSQSPRRRGQAQMVGGPKVDLGERSGRRSRSPATRVGRTESGRRMDPSPGRSTRGNVNREELIENPLVSLECFIFL